jgi:amino acid adenylation domain-containing protein
MTAGAGPLSFGQELFWLLDHATPNLLAYNVPRAFRVRGALDADALGRALDALVRRHEVLRSVYALDGDHPVQTVLADATVPFERVDLSRLAPAEREAELSRLVDARASYHFDLARDVLLRATLVTLGPDDHALVLLTHHIASDGWSKSVTFRDLSELYAAEVAGRAPVLPALPLQFADHARRERERLDGDALEAPLAYWREQLRGPLPVLALPTDATGVSDPFAGDVRTAVLPSSLVDAVRRLGQANGASLYMVLLAAYQSLLHRYTGQDDVVVGSPTAGRDEEETHDLVGYFAGALVLRTSFAGDPTFAELLERVSNTCLDAYDHQDVPFEKLVLELQKGQELTHAPLFQCVLTMEDTVPARLALGDAEVTPIEASVEAVKFDLVLLFSEVADGLRLRLGFRTARFAGERVERMLGHLRTLLEAAVASPDTPVSKLPLLTAEERARLAAWNDTAADEGAPATLVSLFEAQAVRVPERVAVVGLDASLAYAELNARANQLALHLQSLGVTPNAPVGLLLDRSADALVGLLGILKSGGAYMPLSLDAPPARVARQLAESGARVVVTLGAQASTIPQGVTVVALDSAALGALPDANLDSAATPDDLAYVLYTSGSTGTPKGVAVTHANAVHYARAISRVLGEGDGLHFGLASTLAADLGNTSLFASLLGGGTLHVLSKDVTTEPARFAEYVGAHPLDVLKITPNHLAALTAGKTGGDLSAVLPRRWVVTGGEALRPELARTLLGAGRCRVLNHYGPTETTVGVLTHEVTAASLGAPTVPLGRPLANTRAYVVDAHGNEQPVGIPGELLLGGAGVARGYLGRDELTAERFVEHQGERVYRTGDRVRRLADGTIEFLGRVDDQVKVRGFRVELGEIEGVLRAHPGVGQAVAVLRDEELVAYAVPRQAGYAVSHADRPTREKLVEWLAAQLPEYMVPNAVVLLDALPLTPNGKVDRAALPAPEGGAAAVDSFVAPRTPTEETIARIWRDVLKKERVGVTDSFLDLGGHSLLAIRVLGRISKELGVRLPLRALFETPTVAQVAEVVDTELRRRADEEALRQALAAVEGLSDAEAERLLADTANEGH